MGNETKQNVHQELIVAIFAAGMSIVPPGGPTGSVQADSEQAYLARLAYAVSDLKDEAWNKIPEWAQQWHVAAADVMNGTWLNADGSLRPADERKAIPSCPGLDVSVFAATRQEPLKPVRTMLAGGTAAATAFQSPAANNTLPDGPTAAESQKPILDEAKPTPESTSKQLPDGFSKDGMKQPGAVAEEAPGLPTPAQMLSQPAELMKKPVVDVLYAILAEKLSETAGKPTVEALHAELKRRCGRKLGMKLTRDVRTSFYKTVDAMRMAGRLK